MAILQFRMSSAHRHWRMRPSAIFPTVVCRRGTLTRVYLPDSSPATAPARWLSTPAWHDTEIVGLSLAITGKGSDPGVRSRSTPSDPLRSARTRSTQSADKGARAAKVLSSDRCRDSTGAFPIPACHLTKVATTLATGARSARSLTWPDTRHLQIPHRAAAVRLTYRRSAAAHRDAKADRQVGLLQRLVVGQPVVYSQPESGIAS